MYVIKFNSVLLAFERKHKKKPFDFLTKFIEACLFSMLVVLHFTNNSSSFCYSYIAAEVLFQFIKELCMIFTKFVSIGTDSSKSIKHLNYTAILLN